MNKKTEGIILIFILVVGVFTVLFNSNDESDEIPTSESSIVETSVSESKIETVPDTEPEISEKAVTEKVTESVTEIFSKEATEYFTDENNYVEYHFRNEKLLNQHFEKHGSEFYDDFGYQNAQEYEKGASDVINNPEALFKYEAEDGDGVYYIEQTNEFVILSTDGYIRTYFRPSGKIDYFNRQ